MTGELQGGCNGPVQYPVQRAGAGPVRAAKYRGHPLHPQGVGPAVPGVRTVRHISRQADAGRQDDDAGGGPGGHRTVGAPGAVCRHDIRRADRAAWHALANSGSGDLGG